MDIKECDNSLPVCAESLSSSMGHHSFPVLTGMPKGSPVDVSFGGGFPVGRNPQGFGSRNRHSRPVRVPCGTIWPHGEFSLGYTPLGTEDEFERLPSRAGFGGDRESLRRSVARMVEDEGGSPLGLSLPSNSHTPPKRPETYGRKGITANGKKMIRAGATLLQRRYGRRRLSFLTLTLPRLTDDGHRAVARSWGELIRQLGQYLRRRLRRAGLPEAYVLVSECQTRRVENADLGCLHVHVVFVGRKGVRKAWAFRPQEFRHWWLSAISRISGEVVGGCACEELRMVRSNAAGYLGKYMSKGAASAVSLGAARGWDCLPRQWWSVNKSMRDWIKAETRKGLRVGALLDGMVNAYFEGANPKFPGVLFCHQIDAPGGPVTVGYYGRLSEAERVDAIAVLAASG